MCGKSPFSVALENPNTPKLKRKTHLAKPGMFTPYCGGRRSGKHANFQMNFVGVPAVTCLACLRIAAKQLHGK
jgi:hypothetical protein